MPLRTTKTTAGSSSHAVGRRAPARPVERLEARRLFAAAPAAEGDPLVQVFDRVVNENEQQVVFEISVAPGDQPVTMDYATLPGTAAQDADYAPVAGTLTFPASPDPRTATVTVAVVDDLYWEETEWFYLQLSNVTNASLPGDAATYRATATVRDNDRRPAIRVDDVQMTEGDVGEDADAAFTVSLTDPIDRPVSVEYSTADDTAVAAFSCGRWDLALTSRPPTRLSASSVRETGFAVVDQAAPGQLA